MVAVERACIECHADYEMELPDDVPPETVSILIRVTPQRCPGCAARAAAEQARRDTEIEATERFEKARVRRGRSRIPETLRSWTFDSIDRPAGLERAIELGREWAAGALTGLVLSGTVGVGKTRIAVAAANELLNRRQVYFFNGPMLLALIGTGAFGNPEREAVMEILMGEGALVIDDIDKIRPTEYAAEALFLAVNQRTEARSPLLITTNMKRAELYSRWPQPYGEAIVSRIAEMQGVRIEGTDLRRAS